MAIVSVPADVMLHGRVACAICERHIPLAEATVGLLAPDSTQAFACNGHFSSSAQYILGWADYMVAQRGAVANNAQSYVQR